MRRRTALQALLGATAPASAARPVDSLKLIFDSPAAHFTQSLPLGSGRLGAMLFGGVTQERIVLNEISLWSGAPQEADRPGAAAALPEIRRLLLEGKNAEAEKLVNANFICQGAGSNRARGKDVPYGAYQILANLLLKFAGSGAVAQYRRELDIARAVARIEYLQDGVSFTREAFASAPHQAIVIRLSAGAKSKISFQARLQRSERASTAAAAGPDSLVISGALNNGAGGDGMKYAARLRVLHRGGSLRIDGDTVVVDSAHEALLIITAATDYMGFAGRRTPDPLSASLEDLNAAAAQPYKTLLAAHTADYRRYFDRVSLDLGSGNADLPTPARLKAAWQGSADPALAALYFQYGRYLLISSSRPGGLPANLQGLWAEELQTPWNADYHLNVNIQMNYWPAESGNLGDLHLPLFALIESLVEPGSKTARAYYNARGWVAHVITNVWGFTAPGEAASWGSTTTGSAWLCQHLWDHWLFTQDRAFLASFYPVLKGSARFYADMLIEEPSHKWLVTAPANSPENGFRVPDGKTAHVCLGPTVDNQLLRYLFNACAEASAILGVDPDLRAELAEKVKRLPPTRIGPDGRVMEWLEPYVEPEPHHRHVSHLWGLYPAA
ncbi:MAG: glycoside hydrolase family 95 protein, partial [Acidobacteria bacterium]|nr:glycoside hydrolase family 95 protein [Acidobacteriota bacterium]